MKIADLFVKVGIEGAGSVQKGLKNINKGFSGVVGAINKYALAAGAAIFSFKKIVQFSGEAARELRNFSSLTQTSTDSLQRWQFVGKQFGITGEEMASTVISIQEAFAKLGTGEGVPGGYARIAEVIGAFDVDKAKTDPFFWS